MVSDGRIDVPPGFALLAATAITAIALVVALFSLPVGFEVRVVTVVVGTAAQFVASYVTLYRPYSELRYDHRAQLMAIVFEGLLREYAEEMETEAGIRANVMPVSHGFAAGLLPVRERYLEIEFHTSEYGREELEQRYEPGEGCCGQAYVENNPTYYDERDRPLGEGRMSATQRAVTADVKSVLSVPVYHPGSANDEIIAILNLDSSAHIDETKFNEPAAHRLVMVYAGWAGHVLG